MVLISLYIMRRIRWGVSFQIPKLAPWHLFESGAYKIIFGKGATLIRVAALNRSFTGSSNCHTGNFRKMSFTIICNML